MKDNVICPECGATMIPNAVGEGEYIELYVCPNCELTLQYEDEEEDSELYPEDNFGENLGSFSSNQQLQTRGLIVREKYRDTQVLLFESVAVSEELLEKIKDDNFDEKILMAFSQWRVDFPLNNKNISLDVKQRQVISVLEKILERGRLTLISHKLEETFKTMFEIDLEDDASNSLIEKIILNGYKKFSNDFYLDSQEESIFFNSFFPKFLGDNFHQFVLPQVAVSSLISQATDSTHNQRVDFAIFHPKLSNGIIVEINGAQHAEQKEFDRERKNLLERNGYKVVTIDNLRKLRAEEWEFFDEAIQILSPISRNKVERFSPKEEKIQKYIYSFKIAHQIQLSLHSALSYGFLDINDIGNWLVVSDLNEIGIFDETEANIILQSAVSDFIELLGRLLKLYSIQIEACEPKVALFSPEINSNSNSAIFISFSDRHSSYFPTFHVQNIFFPFHIFRTSKVLSIPAEGLEKPEEEELEYFLKYIFRKQAFWDGQYDGIVRVLQGKDTLLLLPTGSGKSLVYQLASMLLPGRTIVIDPIIALMEDQIYNLSSIGIDRCASISSRIDTPEGRLRLQELFAKGEFLFLFVAPERLQIQEFRNALLQLTASTPISLIVIDEAHCISEWGHDFRTSYLNIGRISRQYCKLGEKIPPLIAMTGTASPSVLKDISRELDISDIDAKITPKSFDRPELEFHIIPTSSDEKFPVLSGILTQKLPSLFNTTPISFFQTKGKKTFSGLIFCIHVDGNFGVVKVRDQIKEKNQILPEIYSGKHPKKSNSVDHRHLQQKVTVEFKKNKIPLLVCTKAFGMGIDKPNIRYTIHYNLPPSIESFYQEAGRAGRDKNKAHCFVLVSVDNEERANKLLDPNTQIEEVAGVLKEIDRRNDDDVTRVLYLHHTTFRGVETELKEVQNVVDQFEDIYKKQKVKLKVGKDPKEKVKVEKALHRLLTIGVVSDYTIDYNKNEFDVSISGAGPDDIIQKYGEFIENYEVGRKNVEMQKASQYLQLEYKDFVLRVVELLLKFVYEIIERSRRRAIQEMMLICKGNPSSEEVRQRIEKYFSTEYTEYLEKFVANQDIDIKLLFEEIYDKIQSPRNAEELRGEVIRFLESQPDNFAFLMLRAIAEIHSNNPNYEVVKQNFFASYNAMKSSYGIDEEKTFEIVAWGLSIIENVNENLANEIISDLIKDLDRRKIRFLMEKLNRSLAIIPAFKLLMKIIDNCNVLIKERINGRRS